MPQRLPPNAAAKAGASERCPLNTMYPVNASSVSSGTGSPTIPKTSSRKIARYPYCEIQPRICCSTRSHHEPRDFHLRAVACHHHDAALGDMVAPLAVALQVVADRGVLWHANVLIQNGAADFGAAADIAVVQNDAIVHLRSGVHAYAAAQ